MKIYNPVVGLGVPWYVRILLFFVPMKWSHEEPIRGFITTWSIGYKSLFGIVYILNERKLDEEKRG